MKMVKREIASWIQLYAPVAGRGVLVNDSLRESAPMRYFLSGMIPGSYEAHAVAFHSFWVNSNVPADQIMIMKDYNGDINEDDFKRTSWKDFFASKEQPFELETAYVSSEAHYKRFTQMSNELYAGEGLLDEEYIHSLVEVAGELYGSQEIEAFYTFRLTRDREDRVYEGVIDELPLLLKDKDVLLTPSLIYAKDESWMVNTDLTAPFTFIGGEKKLITALVEKHPAEIYEMSY